MDDSCGGRNDIFKNHVMIKVYQYECAFYPAIGDVVYEL